MFRKSITESNYFTKPYPDLLLERAEDEKIE
jgi:hypothetical protein